MQITLPQDSGPSSVLKSEREIVPTSPVLEVRVNEVDGIFWVHVFSEPGLAVNVPWTLEVTGKRAVGFKLSAGMEVPPELAG